MSFIAPFKLRVSYPVTPGALPNAWRPRLGALTVYDTVDVETDSLSVVTGDICGPILLRFGSFRQILAEALFIDMEPADGRYEALLGYIPLEQAQAVVDLGGHRLAKVDRVDLKRLPSAFANRRQGQ